MPASGYLRGTAPGDPNRFERLRVLKDRPIVRQGWPHQCYCGTAMWVRYRGRVYCQRCGRREGMKTRGS